jgi:hypothetical protein
VDSPWKPSCVVVAVGLIHMSSHGRLVEVCGDEARSIYAKQAGERPKRYRGADPFPSVAFFGLLRDGDALVAVGSDGLYRLDRLDCLRARPHGDKRAIGGERGDPAACPSMTPSQRASAMRPGVARCAHSARRAEPRRQRRCKRGRRADRATSTVVTVNARDERRAPERRVGTSRQAPRPLRRHRAKPGRFGVIEPTKQLLASRAEDSSPPGA